MQNLLNELISLLKKNESFVSDGEILKNAVVEAALTMDSNLLELLLQSETIKTHFFTEVSGALVFDKIKFQDFVSNKSFLPDSYTAFKNKIGLTDGNHYLNQSRDVVLAWPYKDCVLEGGMTKEEDRSNEIFYNRILAPDDITRLFEPKALVNWERWDSESVKTNKAKPVDKVQEEDNLMIKGNNLLALHSLKKQYKGKIQLIYIDPPYNTKSKDFIYNDKFNRSTWLTFMKNRLEVAKTLLSQTGSIYVNIDYHQAHYLKVIMDEIFGEENFQREIIWRIGWLSGYKTGRANYVRNHDTILFYTRNSDSFLFNKLYNTSEDYIDRFNGDSKKLIIEKLEKNHISKTNAKDIFNFVNTVGLSEKYPLEDTWNCSIYDKLNSIAVVSFTGEKVSKMLGEKEFKGQKPEKLLQRIIETSTNKGDIVLDYHAGTGTTAAAAHKLGRKWIAIEQLDDIDKYTKSRLKKVISGDNVGISKSVDWKGGGSFIYTELAKSNDVFIERISKANNANELKAIYDDIKNSGYMRYDIDISEFDENDFSKLPIKDQKKLLIESLDANHLYINLNSLGDKAYNISKEDIEATHSFYKIKK